MKVVITGGCGYIGQCLARALVRRGTLLTHGAGGEVASKIQEIVLVDVARPAKLLFEDELLGGAVATRVAVGSVADAAFCRSVITGDALSVFHLGAVMSGAGEADFDLCVETNLHGTLRALEAARHSGAQRPRFIMASAGATLGSGAPTDWVQAGDAVGDYTRATPHTTYGMTKACAELLLADYSRRGFVDGRGVRLPTICVRAGAPNAATTGCFSGVVRETLAGIDTVAPVGPDVKHAVASARAAVDGLITAHEAFAADADAVLGFDRTVFIPSASVSLKDLVSATHRNVTAESLAKLGKVTYAVDAKLSAAVASFPTQVECDRALKLGMAPAADAYGLVRQYANDFPDALAAGVVLTDEAPPAADADEPGDDSVAVALVTGGGSGIGRAVALRLAGGGWRAGASKFAVVVTGRRAGALEETAALVRAVAPDADVLTVPADLTDPRDVAKLFTEIRSKYGRLDVVFNNAGVNVPPTPFQDYSLADWRKVVGTNLDAVFHVSREAFILMQNQGGGRIINNGSVSAQVPRPNASAYTASKHAVTGLTKAIALDGRRYNIACGQIDYGNVVSDISAKTAAGIMQADGTVKSEPRMGASDAADAVYYMASLPLSANVLNMTVMATGMPFVGRG
ncbi:hypothetical protein M885DRAFT_473019 [Pelagophyceae sp. CCMP2097]|nr:hypothetical protein M885DRAFT_473019 [Pelagophyceae sp. CCMP2097]|mmetsp:Transcript_607/g.2161  ORF Transcript_607/g.2161 Transcript_607/m.2161 type:complete len:630 (+) Transcript_607:107-1996(+)